MCSLMMAAECSARATWCAWNEDGLLEFIGRADDQVKVNGRRIELGEIEAVLLQHSGIAQAALAAHRDNDGAVSLCAYLVWRNGASDDFDSIRTYLAARLPEYMVPVSFTVLEELPLTQNGKLNRKALPKPTRSSRALHAEPVTPVQKKLAALWARILKVDRIGLHDSFFELGGDSLGASQMAAEFPAWFAKELPIAELFKSPTIGRWHPSSNN